MSDIMCLLNVFRNIPGIQERGAQLEAHFRKRYLPDQEVPEQVVEGNPEGIIEGNNEDKNEDKNEGNPEDKNEEKPEEETASKLKLDDDDEEEEIPLFKKPSPQNTQQ